MLPYAFTTAAGARIVLALLASIAISSTAAGEAVLGMGCRTYEDLAMKQWAIWYARNKCGPAGARFHNNRKDHLNWCQNATQRDRRAEIAARQAQLDRCPKSWCERYADRATAQASEQRRLGCGFEGARWAADWNGHFYWCFWAQVGTKRNPEGPGREWQERNVAMNRCKAEKGVR